MKKRVSLREIVGNNVVFAIILVSYYWMWVRGDWQEWYLAVQSVLYGSCLAFFSFQYMRIRKYKKEGVDEMAEQNLKRCDSFCLKLFVAAMIVVAGSCGIPSSVTTIPAEMIGWIIVWSILALSIIRTLMFVIIDSKGV